VQRKYKSLDSALGGQLPTQTLAQRDLQAIRNVWRHQLLRCAKVRENFEEVRTYPLLPWQLEVADCGEKELCRQKRI
jgi:hypothetical protein